MKSVKTLNDKIENAKNLGVELDPIVIAEVNKCTSRLISERNLRFHMEMTKVQTTDNEQVENIKNLIERAEENGVAV